jgi:integrase
MASLYKKPVILRDPKTGIKVKTKSRKWWGRFRDHLGVEHRMPLARDRGVAQTMLHNLVRKAERIAAGCADPFEEHAVRPLKKHIDAFQQYLKDKGDSAQHVFEVATRIRKIARTCKWTFLKHLSANAVQRYLAERREKGLSRQTSNHYLRAIKQFSRWLVRDRRNPHAPLIHLAMLNVTVDRRHDRRPLSEEEFGRLVEAAMAGPEVVCIPGPDRAMMYI